MSQTNGGCGEAGHVTGGGGLTHWCQTCDEEARAAKAKEFELKMRRLRMGTVASGVPLLGWDGVAAEKRKLRGGE